MINIGLIGLGMHGIRYARHLTVGDVDGARLAAFWRRDQTRGRQDAKKLDTRYEPDLGALIDAPTVDAFVAVVPAQMHEAVAVRVAKARKPLLLEKPMARTPAEGERICAAFRKADVPIMIAHTLRFDPLVTRLKARAHQVGKIRGFCFEQRLPERKRQWEDDPAAAGGGVLMQTGVHAIDALRFTTGAKQVGIEAASMSRINYRCNEDQAILIAKAAGRLFDPSDGVIGSFGFSKVGESRHLRYQLFAETVGLEADLIARTFIETHGNDRKVEKVAAIPTLVPTLKAFARLVRDPRAVNPVPPEEGLAALSVVEAGYCGCGAGDKRHFPPFTI